LILCGVRYLAPFAARWVSSDPAGVAGGANSYSYASANPLSLFDPNGTQPESAPETIFVQDETGNYIESLVIEVKGDALDSAIAREISTPLKSPEAFEEEYATATRYPNPSDPFGQAYYAQWQYDPAGAREEWDKAWKAQYGTYRAAKYHELMEEYRGIDRAAGAVNEIIAFELMGVSGAVGIGQLGVLGFGKQLVFSAVLAGSTSSGDFSGCGRLAGLGPLPSAGPVPPVAALPEAGVASSPSVDSVLLQLRDRATDLTRRVSASGATPLTPQAFGSVNDAVFKANVMRAVEDGILPSTIRTSPASMNVPGSAGIDVWDTATNVGWDLTTAKGREVLAHDLRYLNQLAPDGTQILDVRPLVYSRN